MAVYALRGTNTIKASELGIVPDTGANLGPALRVLADVLRCRDAASKPLNVTFDAGDYLIDEYIDGAPDGFVYTDPPATAVPGSDIVYDGLANVSLLGRTGTIVSVSRTPERTEDQVSGLNFQAYCRSVVPFYFTSCAGVRLKGFEIYGAADVTTRESEDVNESNSHGVVVAGCDDMVLEDLDIHHFCCDGVNLGRFDVVVGGIIQTTHRPVMRRVTSRNNARQGVTIQIVTDLTAEDCTFNNNGRTEGLYGRHAPSAGLDVEPSFGAPDVEDVTARLTFTRCAFANNIGVQAYLGQIVDRSSDCVLDTCTIVSPADANNVIAVWMQAPGSVMRDCTVTSYRTDGNGVTCYPDTVATDALIERCTISGPGRNITASAIDLPDTVSVVDCTVTGTHVAPASVVMPLLTGTGVSVEGTVFEVPAAAHDGVTFHTIGTIGCAAAGGNTFRCVGSLTPGLYFQNNYGTTPVTDDYYPDWATFRVFGAADPGDGHYST